MAYQPGDRYILPREQINIDINVGDILADPAKTLGGQGHWQSIVFEITLITENEVEGVVVKAE